MFKSKTAFILGAGASAEVNLPIGSKLTSNIAGLVNIHAELGGSRLTQGDYPIFETLRRLAISGEQWTGNRFLASGRELSSAMELAPSIDTFLQSHATNREYVLLGKMGIARAIAMAEASSLLASPKDSIKPFTMSRIAATWYVSLARQLFSAVPVEEPERAFENVRFIVFNYDRCLQVFLIRALETFFIIPRQRASEIVKQVEIVHPYGTLGSLFEGTPDFVPFGEHGDLLQASERIMTFSETIASERADQIRAMIEDRDTLIFLGFAFHEQNMELLEVSGDARARERKVFATTCGISTPDTQIVRDQIVRALTGVGAGKADESWVSTHDGTCAQLFSDYWRSLTA